MQVKSFFRKNGQELFYHKDHVAENEVAGGRVGEEVGPGCVLKI